MSTKILVIGTHPDDIEFGVGAILLKEKAIGSEIQLVIASKGEAATNGTPEEREAEARKAGEMLGASVDFFDFGGDCHIEYNRQNAFKLALEIRKAKPDVILIPQTTEDQHPDHTAMARMGRDACRFARYGGIEEMKNEQVHFVKNLFMYPSTPNLNSRPDILIDITEQVEDWKKLMATHETQMQTRKYSDLLLAMARHFGLTYGTEYAWGLYKTNPLLLNNLGVIEKSLTTF